VAGIVDACTDADTTPKPAWRPRKERYLRKLRKAPNRALRVAAADKLHNARSILADFRRVGDAVFTRFNGRTAGTLWYYGALVTVFKRRKAGFLAGELERTVRELRRAARGA
jgi:GTP pyrophosphokinase